MKHNASSRLVLARRRTQVAANEYSGFSDSELIVEAMDLHATLASAGDFGRLAELGVRRLALERLAFIDAEHRRRLHLQQAA